MAEHFHASNARIPLPFISSNPNELGKPYRDKAGIDPVTRKKSWFEGVFNQAYDRGFTRSTALEAAQIAVNPPKDLRAYEKARGMRIATTRSKGSTPDFEKVVAAFRRAKKNHPEEAEKYKVSGEEGERREAESREANRSIRERNKPLNKLADFVMRNKVEILFFSGLLTFGWWVNKGAATRPHAAGYWGGSLPIGTAPTPETDGWDSWSPIYEVTHPDLYVRNHPSRSRWW